MNLGQSDTSRSFKVVQNFVTFTLLEQSFCVSLVANNLSLCFYVWFYGFYCNDGSTGKPCNDREKHSLGNRKKKKKHHFEAVELQAASGHSANVSVAERFLPQKQLAMARVNCNKGNSHSPLSTVINDLIIVSMKQIL